MYYDAKQLNKAVMYWVPFALLTAVFVSVGPLLYLALRENIQANKKIASQYLLTVSILIYGWSILFFGNGYKSKARSTRCHNISICGNILITSDGFLLGERKASLL